MSEKEIKIKKEKKAINPFILLFCVLVFMAILSYILPAGQYERAVAENGRTMVVPGTYASIDRTPVGPLKVFAAIHEGMVQGAPIIFYVLLIGGTIGVMTHTGAMNAMLTAVSKKLANNRFWFVAIMVLLFSLGGSFIGMAEEALIYAPIVVPIALALGYDVFTGVAIVMVGMGVGFTTAVMNPFTVGIAQGVAELPLFSGLWLRLVLYAVTYVAFVIFIYLHGEKVRKNPEIGVWGDKDYHLASQQATEIEVAFETRHKLTLATFVIGLVVIVFGVMKLGWYLGEYAAVFVIMGVIMAVVNKLTPDDFIKIYLDGARDILGGALIIGLARAIVVVLTMGNIIDTILYEAAVVLEQLPATLSVAGMFVVQALIHILVPSGSGQAMLTMPIMTPLADILGVTRQTAVLVFTLADGVGNTWIPTLGILMAILSMMKIPYSKWIKNLLPFVIAQYIVYITVCVVANHMGYGPF